ncbi:hypothetical protein TYRP_022558 [Tyrophagus putrescentiae]|nr:hypothetical protein TYRP_022558 [Tyrophagus putrescentiae]
MNKYPHTSPSSSEADITEQSSGAKGPETSARVSASPVAFSAMQFSGIPKRSTAVPDTGVDFDADKAKAQRCTGNNLITTKDNQPKVRLPKNKPITKTEPKTMLAKTEARVADRPRIITIITSKKAEPPTVLAKTEEQVCDRPHFTRTNDNREPVSPFSFPTRGRRLGTQPTVGIQNRADQQRPDMKDAHQLMTNWRSTFRSGSEKELHHYHQNYRPPLPNHPPQ